MLFEKQERQPTCALPSQFLPSNYFETSTAELRHAQGKRKKAEQLAVLVLRSGPACIQALHQRYPVKFGAGASEVVSCKLVMRDDSRYAVTLQQCQLSEAGERRASHHQSAVAETTYLYLLDRSINKPQSVSSMACKAQPCTISQYIYRHPPNKLQQKSKQQIGWNDPATLTTFTSQLHWLLAYA